MLCTFASLSEVKKKKNLQIKLYLKSLLFTRTNLGCLWSSEQKYNLHFWCRQETDVTLSWRARSSRHNVFDANIQLAASCVAFIARTGNKRKGNMTQQLCRRYARPAEVAISTFGNTNTCKEDICTTPTIHTFGLNGTRKSVEVHKNCVTLCNP